MRKLGGKTHVVIASVPSVALSPEENQRKISENERNRERKNFKIVPLQDVKD